MKRCRRNKRLEVWRGKACGLLMSLVALALIGFAEANQNHYVRITPVVRLGDPAPGFPGSTFISLGIPQIDGGGNLMVRGVISGATFGRSIWYGPPGALEAIAIEEQQAPMQPPGVVFDDMREYWLGEDGTISFEAYLAGPGITNDNDRAVYSWKSGQWRLIAQEDDPAPGTPEGTTFTWIFLPTVNGVGQIEIYPTFSDPGSQGHDGTGFWTTSTTGLDVVAYTGGPAPDMGEGITFAGPLLTATYAWNDLGSVVFHPVIEGPGVEPDNDSGVWEGPAGNVHLVAREGGTAPGLPPDSVFTQFWILMINTPGELLFWATVEGSQIGPGEDSGLWAGTSGNLQLVAQAGTPAPGIPGATFSRFNTWFISDTGDITFQAQVQGPGIDPSNDSAIWRGRPGALELLLREGDQAPGLPEGVVLDFGASGQWLRPRSTANDAGDLIFASAITGLGVTPNDNIAIWLYRAVTQGWTLLVRTGDELDGRTIAPDGISYGGSFMNNSGGADGLRQSLNDDRTFVIKLKFTDGVEGVYAVEMLAYGDFDEDGDVDLDDFGSFAACYNGSSRPPAAPCPPGADADFDDDGDVDLDDFAVFAQNFTGAL